MRSRELAHEKVSRFAHLAKAAKEYEALGLGQAGEMIREVRAVPTIFPQVDQVLGVGGWPTDRFTLVHGESNGGKTAFTVGLMLSFLKHDHPVLYIEPERTMTLGWVRALMGPYLTHPYFRVEESHVYEKVVTSVRDWAMKTKELRDAGKLPPESTGICIVDSIRKLAPKKLLDRLMKDDADAEPTGSGMFKKSQRGIDGYGGRAAQFKAALNAQWLDELTGLLYQTGTSMLFVTRETEDLESFDKVKIGGGKALFFEASVVARVTDALGVHNEAKVIVSARHCVQIRKTKVAGKLVHFPAAHFYVSSGAEYAYGFDEARDLLELGKELGVVDDGGARYSVNGLALGHGEEKALKNMRDNPELFDVLSRAVREKFMPKAETNGVVPVVAPTPINRRGARKPTAKKSTKKGTKRGAKKS